MELELLQNTNGSSMINLTAFHSNPLSKYDTSASHAATHEWDTLLESTSVPSMYETIKLFMTRGTYQLGNVESLKQPSPK